MKTFITKMMSLSVLLIGLSDILEPIYSFGKYLVYIVLFFTIYLVFLAMKYTSAEELIEKEKAFAHLDLFKNFYIEFWRTGVIIVFVIILVIASSGAFFTNKNKDSGGYLASNFQEIQSIQKSLLTIIKSQEEISKSILEVDKTTKDIKKDLDLISSQYTRITLGQLVTSLKQAKRPLNELNYVLNKKYIEEPYMLSDVNYLLELTKGTNNYYVTKIAQDAMLFCDKNSFTKKETVKYLKNLKNYNSTGNFNISFEKLQELNKCTDNNTSLIIQELLVDKRNHFFYHFDKEHVDNLTTFWHSCKSAVQKDFFTSIIIEKDEIYDLKRLIKDTDKYGTNCISNDSITYLKEKIFYYSIDIDKWNKIGVNDYKSIKKWMRIGFKYASQAKEWIDIGIDNPINVKKVLDNNLTSFEIKMYKDEGITNISEILEWKKYKISERDAKIFKSYNIVPIEAIRWISLSDRFNPSYIEDYQKLGIFNVEKANNWAKIGEDFPYSIEYWIKDGVTDPKIAKKWIDAGVKRGSTKKWADAGIEKPEIAKRWINAGAKSPKTVKELVSKGINTPLKAKEFFDFKKKEYLEKMNK